MSYWVQLISFCKRWPTHIYIFSRIASRQSCLFLIWCNKPSHFLQRNVIDGKVKGNWNTKCHVIVNVIECTDITSYQTATIVSTTPYIVIQRLATEKWNYENPLYLDVVDRYLRRMGDKTIPDEAPPSLESLYPTWVAGIDLPQSRCGFFVSFTKAHK